MEKIKEILIVLAMLFAALLLVGSLYSCMRHVDKTEYNNGVCQKCGGHLEYEQAVGHQYYTSYIYKCDKCGDRIELYYSPD